MIRFGTPFIVLAGIIFLQYHVFTSVLAQVFLISGQSSFQKLQYPQVATENDGQRVNIYLEKSLAWQKNNALTQESRGDYYWFLGRKTHDDTALSSAANFYRDAISKEPAKAQYWIRLVYVKADLNQFDTEFYLAYENAFHYGGWEYHIGRSLMEIGLLHWYSMSVDSRLLLKNIVIRLYEVNAHPTLQLAQEYGQLHMVCIWVRDEGKPQRLCERELAGKNGPRRENN